MLGADDLGMGAAAGLAGCGGGHPDWAALSEAVGAGILRLMWCSFRAGGGVGADRGGRAGGREPVALALAQRWAADGRFAASQLVTVTSGAGRRGAG